MDTRWTPVGALDVGCIGSLFGRVLTVFTRVWRLLAHSGPGLGPRASHGRASTLLPSVNPPFGAFHPSEWPELRPVVPGPPPPKQVA